MPVRRALFLSCSGERPRTFIVMKQRSRNTGSLQHRRSWRTRRACMTTPPKAIRQCPRGSRCAATAAVARTLPPLQVVAPHCAVRHLCLRHRPTLISLAAWAYEKICSDGALERRKGPKSLSRASEKQILNHLARVQHMVRNFITRANCTGKFSIVNNRLVCTIESISDLLS